MLCLLRSLWFWAACLLLALALVFWLIVLSSMEVHTAYPALASSFVLTAILSRLLLGERLSFVGWLGILVISAGVYSLLGI